MPGVDGMWPGEPGPSGRLPAYGVSQIFMGVKTWLRQGGLPQEWH